MAIVCPTVLSDNVDDYKAQLGRVVGFAKRVHLDMADGVFAPSQTIPITEMQRPEDESIEVNLHVMYQEPHKYLADMLALKPDVIIVHAECGSDIRALAADIHKAGVRFGLALLADTPVETIKPYLDVTDHVLLFAGTLGSHGGVARMDTLVKAKELKSLKPGLEIGWDGGVNAGNAAELVAGGVDVLNAGGAIQHADDPKAAFDAIQGAADTAV